MIHERLMEYATVKVKAEAGIKYMCKNYLTRMCRSTQSRLEINDGKWVFVHKTGNMVDEYVVKHVLPKDPELRRLVDCVNSFINIADEVKETHGVDIWEYIESVTPGIGD